MHYQAGSGVHEAFWEAPSPAGQRILIGVYLLAQVQSSMRRTVQTRLSDFDDTEEASRSDTKPRAPEVSKAKPLRQRDPLWSKLDRASDKWGVCNFDDTVLFVQLVRGCLHAYGQELSCKWCSGPLRIEEDKVFCAGACKRYQGEFSRDLNAYLRWEGVKSYTLRREVAEAEGLDLEPRDLEEISYAPNWSVLYEYDESRESEDDSESL